MNMIKKYLKKYISPEERQKIIDDLSYNGITMEYKKIINSLNNAPNQPSKFKTKNWVDINDESQRTCTEENQIRCKTSVLISRLGDYSIEYILVKGTISVRNTANQGQANNAANKSLCLKNVPYFLTP